MAARAVAENGMPITLACAAFGISESCHHSWPKLQAESAQIADWLVRQTDNNSNWGCGRRIRLFNPIDDFNREALAIDVYFSLPAYLKVPVARPV